MTLRPVFKAKEMFEDHDERFIDVLDYHLTNGWVFSGDDCFLMATEENMDYLMRRNLKKGVDTDTWFVYIYAGNLKRVLDLIPFDKKYVAFRRNNGPIKIYSMKKLLNKLEIQ